MRSLIVLVFVFVAVGTLRAQPPKGPVTPGTTFGQAINTSDAIPVANLTGILKDDKTQKVKVTGIVTEVCPKKGCWVSLQMPDNTKVFVKMKDYGFFVPVELQGKTVVMEADAQMIKTSVAELKHYAEDARKSKEEIDAIKEDKEEIRLTASGIVVMK